MILFFKKIFRIKDALVSRTCSTLMRKHSRDRGADLGMGGGGILFWGDGESRNFIKILIYILYGLI